MPALLILIPCLFILQTGQAKSKKTTYINPAMIKPQTLWSVSPGVNTVTISGDELYIAQKQPINTTQFAMAQKSIDVGKKGMWRVSFEVRMGNLGSTPTGVALYAGKKIVGWVGADGFYRVFGTFFGKDYFDTMDRSVFPFADTEWHTITFSSTNGDTITIQRDGRTVARTNSALRPDRIKVGQSHLLFDETPASLQQAELTMRRLWVESGE